MTIPSVERPDPDPAIRYVLCPGRVTSASDGDRHYISAMQLARLYGVPYAACEIYEPAPYWPTSFYRWRREKWASLIWLHPKPDGDYTLPPKGSKGEGELTP